MVARVDLSSNILQASVRHFCDVCMVVVGLYRETRCCSHKGRPLGLGQLKSKPFDHRLGKFSAVLVEQVITVKVGSDGIVFIKFSFFF